MNSSKPFTEERPWGWFREFTKNEPGTVKILFVRHKEVLSLQKHEKRSEFWRVLSGEPEVTIGDKTVRAAAGDEFEVPPETNHRLGAPLGDVEILEISTGDFDENDIVRIEDKYGRS